MGEGFFEKIAIIGTGLMGGSLGMAARQLNLAEMVAGYDVNAEHLMRAHAIGAIDQPVYTARDAVDGADLVVIATPVGSIPDVYIEISGHAYRTIITDVGSTKARIVSEIEGAGATRFVGGHPIAGGEQEGIEAATPDLFQGCAWILTPTERTDHEAYGTLVRFLSRLGSRVLSLDPARHDELMAITSHLPQILASTLMGFADEATSSPEQGMPLISAGGFRDMTRIAASSPQMWVDILSDNQQAISATVERFIESLSRLRGQVEAGDWVSIMKFFEGVREARSRLPGKPGIGPVELIELLIPVPDKPGVLAEITTTVGELGLNIEDINIVHSAEGGRGTIHLVIAGKEDAERATSSIEERGYTVVRQGSE